MYYLFECANTYFCFMQKTAIILGATGLTGSLVLEHLIANDDYASIKLFSRKSCGVSHPKVQEFVGDVLALNTFKEDFTADEVYVCIGTTRKKTPDSETYRAIDIGIPVAAAELAHENGIKKIAVISAIGADPKSRFEYNRIKGEMEEGVMAAGVQQTFILRPSLIMGNRKEHRGGERFAIGMFKVIRPLLFGGLKKYRGVEASAIAAKMIALCNSDSISHVVESNEI